MSPKRKSFSAFHGAFLVDKPKGLTSHDVVARMRRIAGTRRVGHTGTLDPFATGVLVILVGNATRLARFIDKSEKSYQATISFGYETDTGDLTGEPREAGSEASVPENAVLLDLLENAAKDFLGISKQIPPMYSAKKQDGKKLYELARMGVEVEREAVEVEVSALGFEDAGAQGEIIMTTSVSAGTYIRTLAEDLGKAIGVPCHLKDLRRTAAGEFDISESHGLEELAKASEAEELSKLLIPMNDVAGHLSEQTLSESDVEDITLGRKVMANTELDVGYIRLLAETGELVAIGEKASDGLVQPRIVFKSE
ncbi:MAG: tRNA pseudouridine(55) synthase TruB [Pyrinomonadaceae bacterium]